MEDGTKRNVELLVHVAAPSSARDDARYRTFAAAYLSFEPRKRTNITEHLDTASGIDEDGRRNLEEELLLSADQTPEDDPDEEAQEQFLLSTQERPGQDSYMPDEEEDYNSTQYSTQYLVEDDSFDGSFEVGSPSDNRGSANRQDVGRVLFPRSIASPELSFRSVMDNVNSPVFRGLDHKKTVPELGSDLHINSELSEVSDSWQPPPSTGGGSQDEYKPVKLFPSSPTRVLELYLAHFNTPATSSSVPRRSGRIAALNASSSLPLPGPSQSIQSSVPDVIDISSSHSDRDDTNPNDWSLPMSFQTSTESTEANNVPEAVELPSATILVAQSSSDLVVNSGQEPGNDPGTSSAEIIPKTSSGSVAQGRSLSEQPPAAHGTLSQSATSNETPRPASAPVGNAVQGLLAIGGSKVTVNGVNIHKRRHSPTSSQERMNFHSTANEVELNRDQNPDSNKRPRIRDEELEENPRSKSTKSLPGLKSTPPLLTSLDTNMYQLEIHPPLPPTGTEDITLDSIITKTLRRLAIRWKLESSFRPKEQTRALRPLERGYWLVDWQSWCPKLKERCWSFLRKAIEDGGVGFGIWCTRDEDFRMFRMYCWGGIVGHIYLLLYAASESKIGRVGARWIDGSGNAVITMAF